MHVVGWPPPGVDDAAVAREATLTTSPRPARALDGAHLTISRGARRHTGASAATTPSPRGPGAADDGRRADQASLQIVYTKGSGVRLAPPLCVTRDEVDRLVGIVADSIAELEKECAR